MSITKSTFGHMPDGCEVELYTLTNKLGSSVEIITLGGALRAINVPDKDYYLDDVICGYDTVEDYIAGDQSQGALIGRFANRIKDGRFTLNGTEYQLPKNDGENHLHGGADGFGRRVWSAVPEECGNCDKLHMHISSPDGDAGYPGNLELDVTYTFDDDTRLTIDYRATTDRDTVCNFTNHAYFNLAGYASCDVSDHVIWLAANYITETDDQLIPTGKLLPVKNTRFDLRSSAKLTECYDDNFVLNEKGKDFPKPKFVCEVKEPTTGRRVRVYTTMPGIQVYAGGFMDGGIPFKGGRKSFKHCAFCLETQRWPDSPNHENFTDCTLRAGEEFRSTTIYEFTATKRRGKQVEAPVDKPSKKRKKKTEDK